MTRVRNHIESALLGYSHADALRTVAGYNWVQHLAMAAILDDRNDIAHARLRSRMAAKSFVASLQLLARPGQRQWFHLSDEAVMDRFGEYMLTTLSLRSSLFDHAYGRFKSDVAVVMTEVVPHLGRLAASGDFSMLVNVYLNTVETLPDGIGVYFVRNEEKPCFTDVVIYPPPGFQRFIDMTRKSSRAATLDEAVGYYAILVSQHEAGNIQLSFDELFQIEETLSGLVTGDWHNHADESFWLSHLGIGSEHAALRHSGPIF
jgi:hypothetical protein